MFSRDDLNALLQDRDGPCVSIYMPAHVGGPEVRQDAIRIGNLVRQADEKLEAFGYRRPEIDELLRPIAALADDGDFRAHLDRGVAIFAAPGARFVHVAPIDFEEEVVVGPRFHVKHLLPLLEGVGDFFMLTLTADAARLMKCSDAGCYDMRPQGFPRSVGEIYGETDYQNTDHANPVGRPRVGDAIGVARSQNLGETPEELGKAQLVEYVHRVEAATEKALRGVETPLVLAADAELLGHFRKISKMPNLLAEGVDANPEGLDERDLHARALELVRRHQPDAQANALGHYHSLAGVGDPRAASKAEDVVNAALDGRVDTLLIADGRHLWGRVDNDSHGFRRVEAHGSPQKNDADLLDLAAAQTLLKGGHVRVLPADKLPQGSVMAAILRF